LPEYQTFHPFGCKILAFEYFLNNTVISAIKYHCVLHLSLFNVPMHKIHVRRTVTRGLRATPDSYTFVGRCTFDVFFVRSVVKSLAGVTRAGRSLRELHEVICIRQSVLCQ